MKVYTGGKWKSYVNELQVEQNSFLTVGRFIYGQPKNCQRSAYTRCYSYSKNYSSAMQPRKTSV